MSPHGPDVDGAVRYALKRLKNELSPDLVYHTLYHTRVEVMTNARELAHAAGLPDSDLHLLLVAAAYHDLGFVTQVQDHEQVGADIAQTSLPSFGFDRAQINEIQSLILATRPPYAPATRLAELLIDADLSVLGQPNFMTRIAQLRQELAFTGQHYTDAEWYRRQRDFQKQHRYFTLPARERFSAGKAANMEKFRAHYVSP